MLGDPIVELDLVRYHAASFSVRIDHFGHELLVNKGISPGYLKVLV